MLQKFDRLKSACPYVLYATECVLADWVGSQSTSRAVKLSGCMGVCCGDKLRLFSSVGPTWCRQGPPLARISSAARSSRPLTEGQLMTTSALRGMLGLGAEYPSCRCQFCFSTHAIHGLRESQGETR